MAPYFNASHLPQANNEYVAWVDVMGVQKHMARSISTTANFIFKLHVAALESRAQLTLYPVMDGVYATTPNQAHMLGFLTSVFSSIADEFSNEQNQERKFIIRAGLAFGPTIHGSRLSQQASPTLHNNMNYRSSILLGLPMVQAHLGERSAPPFGVFVHESARSFAPQGQQPIHFAWWRWKSFAATATWDALTTSLPQHFDWCLARSLPLEYDEKRIEAHAEMYEQYTAD